MKKKKILFHINSLGMGGAERVVAVLSRCFAEDEYNVTIVTLWRAQAEYQLANEIKRIDLGKLTADTKKAGNRRILALRRFLLLRKIIKSECPDIVISFCVKANFRSAFSMMGMKTPLMVSVRNDPERDYTPHNMAGKWMEKKAAGCVFQTQDAKEFFSLAFQRKSRIIWNPVDEKYLVAGQGSRPEKSKDAGRRNDIVTVGRLSRQKNQILLLRAFNRIKEQFPHTRIRIYGDESDKGIKEEMMEFLARNEMQDRVEFMGHTDSLEKKLQNAAMFVLPSDYEGMPNALIEAMVLGLPVIATDCPCGGSAMLIEDGVSGLLVPVGDEEKLSEAISRLLSDRQLAELMGINAGKIRNMVSPQKIYEEWKSYVEEIIQQHLR